MKIRGIPVCTTTPRPDYAQENEKKADYIKNRPVPLPKEKDEGKVLRVVGGKWVPDSNVATLDENGKIASELLQLDSTLSDTSENPVMNRVVKAALVAMGSGTKMATGSYVGAVENGGTTGRNQHTSLTLPFAPKLLIIIGHGTSETIGFFMPNVALAINDIGKNWEGEVIPLHIAEWGTTCTWYNSWYGDYPAAQLDDKDITYYYVAFGEESYTAWDGGEY